MSFSEHSASAAERWSPGAICSDAFRLAAVQSKVSRPEEWCKEGGIYFGSQCEGVVSIVATAWQWEWEASGHWVSVSGSRERWMLNAGSFFFLFM